MVNDLESISRARRADGETTYQQLLDAALTIWSEQGIGHVTMNAVAKRAHRTRGTAYHHFADHPALIAAVENELERRLERLFDINDIDGRQSYLTFTDILINSPDILRGYFTQLLRSGSGDDPVTRMALKHFHNVQNRGWMHEGIDPHHAALISIAMWLAAMMAAESATTEPARRQVAEDFAKTYQLFMERSILKPGLER
jgi:AcrR family transcriptional regulator